MDTTNVPSSSGLRGDLTLATARGPPCRVRSLASPAPIGRLTSLRTRDLTLGGALKKSKVTYKNKGSKSEAYYWKNTYEQWFLFVILQKTFEPNIHAVRKSKEE